MGDVRVSDEVMDHLEQAVIVRPGDTLILRVGDRVTPEMVERVAAAVKAKLPDLEVMVLGGVEELAVYRPEPPLYSVRLSDDVSAAIKEGVEQGLRSAASAPERRRTG